MKFQEYVDILDSLLRKHWAVIDSPVAQDPYNQTQGTVEGKVALLDGSFIDSFEEIVITSNNIEKRRYSYQYVKNQNGSLPLRQLPQPPRAAPALSS